MRVLIEGIGGVGGVIAARMIRAGHIPALVTGNPAISEAINKHGVRVKTPGGRLDVDASAVTSVDQLDPGPVDYALLVMKEATVLEAARATAPLLGGDGCLVTCQNGIVEDAVSEAVGAERVVSCIVGFGATMLAPGRYEQTSLGEIHIGELDGSHTDRLRGLGRLLASVCPVHVHDNIRGALWAKLAINAAINALGVLTGQPLGTLLRDRRVRDALARVYCEVIDTAEACGVTLERINVDPYLLYMPRDASWWTRARTDLLVRLVGFKYRRLRSSSLQSLERGRKTEVDSLNGYVVEQAAKVGTAVPVNTRLVELIHEIENGERQVSRANMDDLVTVL